MEKIIKKENIIVKWVLWHYWEMPKFLFSVWKNYIYFGLDLFSVPLLLKTFFNPWRRSAWQYPKNFDIGELGNVFISNIFSRFLGAIMRFVFIISGAFIQIFILIFGFLAILLWLLIPAIIILGIMYFFGII